MTTDDIVENNIEQTADQVGPEELSGSCFIVGMPIGDQDDFTTRAVRTLQGADLVVASDERDAARLMKRFALSKRLMGIGEEIAEDVTEAVLDHLRNGDRVVIMSDSLLVQSEPIRWLANRIREAGLEPRVVPGVDLATTALLMSGFPSEQYFIAAYIPSRREQRDEFIRSLSERTETIVFFASAPRLNSSLTALAAGLPDRACAVILKPTVPGERILRGNMRELQDRLASKVLTGTATIVLGPIRPAVLGDASDQPEMTGA